MRCCRIEEVECEMNSACLRLVRLAAVRRTLPPCWNRAAVFSDVRPFSSFGYDKGRWKHHHGSQKTQRGASGFTMVAAAAPAALQLDVDRRKTIEQADMLYNEQKFVHLVEFLSSFQDEQDPEVLWRLARGLYEVSKQKSEPEKQKLIAEALARAEAANQIDGENFAIHKWLSILVDAMSNYGGLKQRITESKRVQFHMKKACQLKPSDGTSWHLLGLWCYTVADIPWYQRKVASTFVAAPPEATFQEALDYFLKAEEVEPNFYSTNHLFIGKSYLKLGDKASAKTFLEKAASCGVVTNDDKKAHQEAAELLKKI